MYTTHGGASDSIAHGANNRTAQKGATFTKWALIALAIAIIISFITIFSLSSKLSTVQDDYNTLQQSVGNLTRKYEINPFLSPLQFYKEWTTDFTMTPQTLDEKTAYTTIVSDDAKEALT